MKHITPALLRRWALPKPNAELGKESRGHALVIGGSDEIPGAIILAAIGALRAGAGTLQIATTKASAMHVAIAVPEARVCALATTGGEISSTRSIREDVCECDTVLVGPGMTEPRAARELLRDAARKNAKATFVIDAGALEVYDQRMPRVRAVLTPHAGEMAKLCGATKQRVLADPHRFAAETAKRLGTVVALKGAATHVVAPDGRSWLNTAGNIGLGTSGSGDTLSGVIAGLCARGAEPAQAAVWGVYLHALAGDRLARKMGPLGFLARELLTEIPALLATLDKTRN